MKTPKEPTPLQLFKQWKKYNLASSKADNEKNLLDDMVCESANTGRSRITVDGFIYELNIQKGNYSWNSKFEVTNLGSVEEFSRLIK
jgi:hypothetical protein